jgi:DNA-binding response OmpR family regulator
MNNMNTQTVLVIDDEEVIATAISRALKKEGYSVIITSDYKTSIKVIANSEIDLIISDVMLPYTGGFDIVEYVKNNETLKHTPVILVTGMDRDILYSSSIKADAVVSKPFDMERLIALVKINLKEKELVTEE